MSAAELAGIVVVRGGRRLLDGIDLAIPDRGHIALVGPNGAGKSTLLRVIAGLIVPRQGQVRIAGRPLADWPRRTLADHRAWLPQSPRCHWPFSVRHLLRLGAGHGGTGEPDPQLVAELGLTGLLDRRLDTLSGGEAARAFLGHALAGSPRLLLADEPGASLDPAQQQRIFAVLSRLAERMAVVTVVHDLAVAARYAQRIAVLAEGRLVACDSADRIVAGDDLDCAFGVRFHRVALDGRLVPIPGTA